MPEERPADAAPARRTASQVLRPLVDRTRSVVATPVLQTEARLMQRLDEAEQRIAARIDAAVEATATQRSEAHDAVREQRLLYVSIRHLLEEQAEELSSLRSEVAELRAVTGREPVR